MKILVTGFKGQLGEFRNQIMKKTTTTLRDDWVVFCLPPKIWVAKMLAEVIARAKIDADNIATEVRWFDTKRLCANYNNGQRLLPVAIADANSTYKAQVFGYGGIKSNHLQMGQFKRLLDLN